MKEMMDSEEGNYRGRLRILKKDDNVNPKRMYCLGQE